MYKKSWKNLFELNQIVQIVGLVVAASLIWNTVAVVQKNYALQQQVDRLKDEIAILELEQQQLLFNIEYYKTDEYLELAAREKFNKKAPGERVVALSKNETTTANTATAEETADQTLQEQNFDEWMRFLFRRPG